MKLVRDNIPAIAAHRTFRVATDTEVVELVREKLMEELVELVSAITHNEKVEELADLLEVMHKFAKVNGIDWNSVIIARDTKNLIKGKFDGNIVLE